MTKKILIVEDTRTIPEVIKIYLVGRGYEYVVASNGREGLAMVSEKQPHLIISDINMPLMNGNELCRAVKGQPRTKSIPVLLLSSKSDSTTIQEGVAAGAAGFLKKPINGAELAQKVRALLGE